MIHKLKLLCILLLSFSLLQLTTQNTLSATAIPGHLYCDDDTSINTAVGCISTDITSGEFFTQLITILVGLSGGIALLLILVGIFIITTSTGIPDKITAGKNIITAAVSGLIFIILSVFIMNLIGVKILVLPGL